MISKKAAAELYAVLKDYVLRERIPNLLLDLGNRVAGNQSYRDTVQAMTELYWQDEKKRTG